MIILEQWIGKGTERKSRIPAFVYSNEVSFRTARLRRYKTRTFLKERRVLITPLLDFIFRVFSIYLSAFRVILFYSFQLRLSESRVFTVSWIPSSLLQDIHTPNAKICGGVMQNWQRRKGMHTYDTKYEIQPAFLGPPRMEHSLRQLSNGPV